MSMLARKLTPFGGGEIKRVPRVPGRTNGYPRVEGIPPRHRPVCRTGSGSVLRSNSIGPPAATRLPRETGSGGRRDGTQSRHGRGSERTGEFACLTWPLVLRCPALSKGLGGRASIQACPWTVEPAPDAYRVVGACQIPDEHREKVQPGGDRIGRGTGTRPVALRARRRYAQKPAEQPRLQHLIQRGPFVRWRWRLFKSLCDRFKPRCVSAHVQVLPIVQTRPKDMPDARLRDIPGKATHGGSVQAINRLGQQPHRIGADQGAHGCGREPRILKRTLNGCYLEFAHNPNCIRFSPPHRSPVGRGRRFANPASRLSSGPAFEWLDQRSASPSASARRYKRSVTGDNRSTGRPKTTGNTAML